MEFNCLLFGDRYRTLRYYLILPEQDVYRSDDQQGRDGRSNGQAERFLFKKEKKTS
jgi:hypothetical protein